MDFPSSQASILYDPGAVTVRKLMDAVAQAERAEYQRLKNAEESIGLP